jgi:hypothetical protein
VVVVVKFLNVLTKCREYGNGKLKYLIELGCVTYHPTVLTSFPCGHMVSAERSSVLEGGGPVSQNGNKGEKLHV